MNTQINPMLYPGLMPLFQLALQGVTSLKPRNIDAICCQVCEFYDIKLNDLRGKSRHREIVLPRQTAMYLIKQATDLSLTEIGNYFNRDHSTVIYAIRTVEDISATDKNYRRQLQELQDLI